MNTVLFEILVDFRVPWERFWELFGHLFGHGCESENSAGACTGARFSRFMGVGIGPFGEPCANVVLRDFFYEDLNQFRFALGIQFGIHFERNSVRFETERNAIANLYGNGCKQKTKLASKQANKQEASKKESKQVSKQASKQVSKQADQLGD